MMEKYEKNKAIKYKRKNHPYPLYNFKRFVDIYSLTFFLIIIYNIITSNCSQIYIKVNSKGTHQIISDNYDINNYNPSKIIVNGEVQILRDKKVLVEKINPAIDTYEIRLEWNTFGSDFAFMFANLPNIKAIRIDNMFKSNSNISYMLYNCVDLEQFKLVTTSGNIANDTKYMFYNCHKITSFSFQEFKFNNNEPIDMSYMFYNCTNLRKIINSQNKIKVNNMKYSFYNCTSLTSISLNYFESSNSIDLSYAFYNCHSLNNVSISNDQLRINDIRFMFYNNTSLENLNIKFNSNLNEFYNMSYAFYNCLNLTAFSCSNWYIRPNDMRNMFYNCSNLNSLELFLGASYETINMRRMFFNCKNITQIELKGNTYDSNKHYNYYPNDLHAMFYNCESLISVNLYDCKTNYVKDMSYMFYNCLSLSYLDISKWNIYNVTDMNNIFYNCLSLSILPFK